MLESCCLDYLDLPVPISIGIMRKEALKILRSRKRLLSLQRDYTTPQIVMEPKRLGNYILLDPEDFI